MVNHIELVRHFRSTEDEDKGAIWGGQHAAEVLELAFHEKAGGRARHVVRDAL
jgi:hypothetical protein